MLRVLWAAENQIAEASAEFSNLFFSKYSDYGGQNLVGVDGLGCQQLAHDRSHILKSALGYLWEKHETFDCKESDVDSVVNEFEEFVDSPTMRIRFQAQLLNFSMDESVLSLPENLMIRRLNEREISALHGGPLMRGGSSRHSSPSMIHQFVVEGEYLGAKVVAGKFTNMTAQETANTLLDKTILCLRNFKEGSVGYQWVDLKFVRFCPLFLGSYGSISKNVPPGIYNLSNEEVIALPDFAQNIFKLSESALETACARLADAESRLRHQDQILDAVVGMEALLLASLAKEDRRSELKYRFSMNYSTLFDSSQERWHAYCLAKDLYDHRSAIAHGGDLDDKQLRVGEEKLSMHEVAKRAKGTLRMVIKHFLPLEGTAPYKKSRFWEHKYFGLSASQSGS